MGHAVDFLSFDTKMSKEAIQNECDQWANDNCDHYETGPGFHGLPSRVNFSNRIFDDYASAADYLDKTTGNYSEIAVQYRKYPPLKKTAEMQRLFDQEKKATLQLEKLNEPHYKGTTVKTVRCKSCGSAIATAYCGDTWRNKCPVCKADMRPESKIQQVKKCEARLLATRRKLTAAEQEANKKQMEKAELCWLVACEVHC